MKLSLRIVLVVLSVLLITASFPPFYFWGLSFVAWLPLLVALKGATVRQGFYLGFGHGVLTFGGTLIWMFSIFSIGAVALWAILALFTAFFAAFVSKRGESHPLIIATIWTGFEYCRGELFWLNFPWITPGTGLPPSWVTAMIGSYGVGYLVILANAFLLKKGKSPFYGVGVMVALLIAQMTFTKVPEVESDITVTLIQNEVLIPEAYLATTLELSDGHGPIVWPEYAYGEYLSAKPEKNEELFGFLAKHERILVTGGKQGCSSKDGKWKNSAFTFDGSSLLGTHVKNHPVHFFDDGQKGTTAEAVETSFGRIGTPICFDCDYQDVVRKMTKDGAEFFLVPSMDAEHWTARQHEQHAVLFRHRAAENGRSIAVAATSGVTQIIGPHGHVRARLPGMGAGVLEGKVTSGSYRTLFQAGGWLFGPLMLVLTGCIIFQMKIADFGSRPDHVSKDYS